MSFFSSIVKSDSFIAGAVLKPLAFFFNSSLISRRNGGTTRFFLFFISPKMSTPPSANHFVK
jgi:hypothetical protein